MSMITFDELERNISTKSFTAKELSDVLATFGDKPVTISVEKWSKVLVSDDSFEKNGDMNYRKNFRFKGLMIHDKDLCLIIDDISEVNKFRDKMY